MWANSLNTPTVALAQSLIDWFCSSTEYVVALSGGVDSAVVACAAKLSGVRVTAATGIGPATAQHEQDDARCVVGLLAIEHHWLETGEYSSPDYRRNDLQRCFHCKTQLFAAIKQRFPLKVILTGTNLDDLSDFRPGLEAARQAAVRAPLAELRIDKRGVRELAAYWNLPIADKPASPCLASRIAYGVEVTHERLRRVELAEQFLKQFLQLADCRVRVHADEMARIEIAPSMFARLLEANTLAVITAELQRLGFRYVTLDLAGQRSGSLNPTAIQADHSLIEIQLPRTHGSGGV
jgi:pyridinium-3,5-biscarboxylic acid mononucleotide sulfurtransferase